MDTTDQAGRLLDGRYRVGGVIARGGMSTVYRGVDTRLGRPVAIKVMSAGYATDPAFLTRFEREARLAATLQHPGVVAVYDQGEDGDTVFLVMELVDGGTLRDLLRQQGPLPVPVAITVLEDLLSALGAAHAAGLVHRDVKPENVLISSTGAVKVADFGLVRAVSSQTMATGDVILGTVAYLSPEQVAVGTADARSDVYAAGIVGYEMLVGSPPYSGDNAIAVAYQHVHSDVPPVTDRSPGVPLELDDLLLAATRRDPNARPRDAQQFAAALGSVRRHTGIGRVRVPTPATGTGASDPARTRPAVGPGGTRMVPAPLAGTGQRTVVAPTSAQPTTPATRLPARRRGGGRRWLVAILVVMLLAALAAAGGWWLGGRWAYAPRLAGMDQTTAVKQVLDAGLVPQVSTSPDNTVPAGTVAGTEPDAGTKLLRGSTVTVVMSTGRPVVPVIAAGSTVDAAKATLAAARLTPRLNPELDAYSATVAAGTVVGTEPAAGARLSIDAPVTVILSRGQRSDPVPPVAGKSTEDARNALLAAGFTIGPEVRKFSAETAVGQVLGTSPAAGQRAPQGSPVSLVLADSLTVPAVRGRPVDAVVAELAAAGFRPVVGEPSFDPEIDGGATVRTDPEAGTRIDPAAPIVTVIGSTAVTIPDLTTGSVADARRQLTALGLQTAVTGWFAGDTSKVYRQDPAAGSRIEPGGTVRIGTFWS